MRASDLARQEAEEEEDVWAKEFDDGSCSSEDCDEYGVEELPRTKSFYEMPPLRYAPPREKPRPPAVGIDELCALRQVTVRDLNGRKELNGQRGRILGRLRDGRWPVRVYAAGGIVEVKVKAENLEVYSKPLLELLDERQLIMLAEACPPDVAAQLLCCSRATARAAEAVWTSKFCKVSPQWAMLADDQLKGKVRGAAAWRERLSLAVGYVRTQVRARIVEPDPRAFYGHDVSDEHAAIKDILDSPRQVHPAMRSYEGCLGSFRQDARRAGESLSRKGGKKLMEAFLEYFVNPAHGPQALRTARYAWRGVLPEVEWKLDFDDVDLAPVAVEPECN